MKRINIIFSFIIALVILLITSCKTHTFYTTLNILRPADVAFESNVQNILIVNNAVSQPDYLGHTFLSLNGEIEDVEFSTKELVSLTLSVLREKIEETQFFSSVELLSESVTKNNDFGQITPLQYKEVIELSGLHKVDAIVSLDYMRVIDALVEYYDRSSVTYYVVIEAVYETLWSIHYPNQIEITALHYMDTLYWSADAYFLKNAMEKLPDREDALYDGAVYVGLSMANRFIPYWEDEDRYFYSSKNALMKQAMDSVYRRNWEGAINLWESFFEKNSNKSLKLKTLNNIAIGYEILGDYDNAIGYVQKALDIVESSLFWEYDYMERLLDYYFYLTRRKEEINLLEKQLND